MEEFSEHIWKISSEVLRSDHVINSGTYKQNQKMTVSFSRSEAICEWDELDRKTKEKLVTYFEKTRQSHGFKEWKKQLSDFQYEFR